MLHAVMLAIAVVQAAPPQDSADEQVFAQALGGARTLIDKKEWKKAEAIVRDLLAQHEKRPYVWLYLPELRDDLLSCTFWQRYEEPELRTLVSGELLSYSKSGVNLRIRYTPETLRDFELLSKKGEPEVRLHPAVFAGSYSIEVKGDSYPEPHSGDVIPTILIVLDAGQVQAAHFGVAPIIEGNTQRSAVAKLSVRRDGEWKDEEARDPSPCQAGRPYAIKVKVSDTKITATYNDRPVLSGSKTSDVFGQFAFVGLSGFDEMIVQGNAQPSWIQGLADAHLQKEWKRFQKSSRSKPPLPDWLKLKKCGAFEALSIEPHELPSTASDALRPKLAKILSASKKSELQTASSSLEELASQVSPELRNWLQAVLQYRMHKFDAALEACEKLCSEQPDFRPAQLLRARLFELAHDYESALDCYRALSAADPDDLHVAANRAMIEFTLGNAAELDAHLRDQVSRSHYTEELDKINSLSMRARNGPGWNKSVEVKTEHYVIASDLDRKSCIEAGEMLENSLARFTARLRPLPGEKSAPFRVYIFSGFAGYSRYVEDALNARAENTAGLYHLGLKQLLVWNLPDHKRMMETVRHEGLHQYLDRFPGEAPSWFNEGLAEYYENADFKLGPSREIQVHPEHVRVLQAEDAKLVPIAEFIAYDPEQFYGDPELDYAQAWALVHFLLNSNAANRKVFSAMVDAIQAGASAVDATEGAFEDVDLAALERDFRAHVGQLEE